MTNPQAIAQKGSVYLVGAGPGDPELLTVKAARLLATADVVLHDDLVPAEIVAQANPRAWVLNVGKRCGAKSITQDEINRLMIDFAQSGLAVVRLKSGDPLVFGRAGEEMDALRHADLNFEVVPGITAAFAAAAALRCSLTDRRAASSMVFSTGHHARSTADREDSTINDGTTRIVYMPGRDLRSLADEWLADGLSPELPCVLVSRAALPDQQVQSAPLADLGNIAPGATPNLLIAGWALRDLDGGASSGLIAAAESAFAAAP
jgi:uroporphyrin-III C-methyltransferase